MDLSKFTAVDSIEVTIYHGAFEPGTEPVFTVAGPCHVATKKADKTRSEAIIKARGNRFDAEKLAIEHTAARILGWKGVVWEGGELEYSPENALMLLSVPALRFVRDQIIAALGDDEAFFKA